VGGRLNLHPITRQESQKIIVPARSNVRQQRILVIEPDAKQIVRQSLDDGSLQTPASLGISVH
jgi:hypothetical protein